MANPYVNKVVYGNSTLIDLTADTVTPATLMQGYTAHDASGALITGTATGGSGGNVWQDQDGYIHLDDEGGGPAPSGDTWSWMGRNPTLIHTFPKEHSTFRELGVGDWTWSTTQTILRAAQNYEQVALPDISQYTYIQVYRARTHLDYGDWTPSAAAIDTTSFGSYVLFFTFGNINAYESGAPNTLTLGNGESSGTIGLYYPANASRPSFLGSLPYGVFVSSYSSPSYVKVSGTDSTYTITFRVPALYIRGSNSYFSETAFANIDLDESFFEATCEVWRADAVTNHKSNARYEALDILKNGL